MDYQLKLRAESLKDEIKEARKTDVNNEFKNCLNMLSDELNESQMLVVENILRHGLVNKVHEIIFDYDKLL